MARARTELSSCLYHFGDLVIPGGTGDPWNDTTQKCLVACVRGSGRLDALCFRTDYYGVWFGFQIDDHPLDIVHNGHCLQNMGLIGSAADGMPFFLPFFNGPDDLSVACRKQHSFDDSFRLWMGNSHPTDAKRAIGLHVYVTGQVQPAPGSRLDWSVVVPGNPGGRGLNTERSGAVIRLDRWTADRPASPGAKD